MARDRKPTTAPAPWEIIVAWPVVSLRVVTLIGFGITPLLAASGDEVMAPDAMATIGRRTGEQLELSRKLSEQHESPLVLLGGRDRGGSLSRAEVVQACGDVGEVGVREESAHEVGHLLQPSEGGDGLGAGIFLAAEAGPAELGGLDACPDPLVRVVLW